MAVSRFTTAAALALVAGACDTAAAAVPADGDNAQRATWMPQEQRFVYQGFTTRYSCEGLREKLRSALLALGARQDLTVNATSCSSPRGGPEPFPGVAIRMQVLTPVTRGAAVPDAPTVAAHWKTLDLRLDGDTLAANGDCELIEQIRQSILPLFSTRNIEYRSTCVPHQRSAGGTRLRAEILVADAPDVIPAGAAAAQ
ncbi:MAG: hypothetical protein PVSMB6_10210 [Steroidobacteraceae bacterium]